VLFRSDGRDGVWAHPDLVPTAADLDDPMDFADRVGVSSDVDPIAELKRTEDAERDQKNDDK